MSAANAGTLSRISLRSIRAIVRTVPASKDYIRFKGRLWKVPQAFRCERVAIRPLTADGCYGIFFGAHQIASIDLTKPECVGDVSEQVSAMSSD